MKAIDFRRRYNRQVFNMLKGVFIVPRQWSIVMADVCKLIGIIKNLACVEYGKDRHKGAPIVLIRNPSPVIAFA